MIEDAFEHIVRNAHAIHSLFVVAAAPHQRTILMKSHWVGRRDIASEFVTLTLEEMGESEVEHLR